MNINKIEKQLKKINQLFQTIKEDGTVSAIEKDLMLSYVRGLYEKIALSDHDDSDDPSISKVKKNKEAKESTKKEKPVSPTNHIADVVMQEVVEANQRISHDAPAPQSPPISASSVYQQTVVQEVKEEQKPQIPKELLELFESETISELSDKLSRSPISDLTKSMGINEKIFTIEELFGGDKALFDNAMKAMDKLSSLEQARDYLVEHVALNQNWHADGKLKKAANFIKLISRRY